MRSASLPADGSVRDAVVIGAGPAGSAAAVALCRAGLEVLLVERRPMPRWKVCGCCLEGSGIRALRDIGAVSVLEREWVPLRELRLQGRGLSATLTVDGRAVSRERLDLVLAGAAREAGAEVCWPVHARPGAASEGTRRVHLRTPEGPRTVKARVVIGAWGLGAAGSEHRDRPPERREISRPGTRIGVGATLPGDRLPVPAGQVRMLVGDDGYLGLVRLEDGSLNAAACLRATSVAGSGGPTAPVGRILAAAGLDSGAAADAGWSGTPPLRRFRPRVRERLVTVGDAAGFWEPFTGEGIAWALETGAYVGPAAASLAFAWSDARARGLARRLRRRLLLRQARSRLVAVIAGSPPLARAALRVLSLAPALGRPLCPLPAAAAGRGGT